MTIARYKQLDGHPVWLYTVELLVQTRDGTFTKIAEFNCKDEDELKFATDCVDYVRKGEKK